ncbi:hypothetical protein R3P38DRAFT_3355975 [Favolaschia claudopus]|uniref:Uncharacterized protein n=1 Tax=Favolaschia claudopus TaxID=2862362 RepID=A0AAW0BJH6_9AGAR
MLRTLSHSLAPLPPPPPPPSRQLVVAIAVAVAVAVAVAAPALSLPLLLESRQQQRPHKLVRHAENTGQPACEGWAGFGNRGTCRDSYNVSGNEGQHDDRAVGRDGWPGAGVIVAGR